MLYLSEVVWICCNRLRIRWGFIDRFGVSILGNLGYFRWKIAFSQVFVRDLLLDLRSRRNGRNKYDEPSRQIYIYIYMNLKKKKRGCPSPHSNFRTLPSYQWEGIYFAPRNIPRNTMFLTWGRRLAVAVLEYWALDPADWWMLHENRSKPNLCATEIISNYCSRPVCQNLHPSQRRPYFVSYTVLIA